MKYLRILLLLLLSGYLISCSDDTQADQTSNTVQSQIDPLATFIPQGYAILDSAYGDLNLDTLPDLVLILKKEGEETSSEPAYQPEERPLLILIGENEGFRLAAQNKRSVYCVNCGGMMGDPYQGMTIKNGYVSVEHYGGSGSRWSRIITYRYDKKEKHWFLHRDGGESFQVSNPDEVETTMRTKEDFGQLRFEEFDIYESYD